MYMVKVVTPLSKSSNVGDKLENKSDAGHALSTPMVFYTAHVMVVGSHKT